MPFRKMRANHSTTTPTAMITLQAASKTVASDESRRTIQKESTAIAANYIRIVDHQATRRKSMITNNQVDLWDWVDDCGEPKRTTWIIGHGIGQTIRLAGLFPRIESGEWFIDFPGSPKGRPDSPGDGFAPQAGLLCLADPPTIVCVRSPSNHRYLICDVRNWIDKDLSAIAEYVFMERIIPPGDNETRYELMARLDRDCEIVESLMLRLWQWWAENDFGMWRWTIAACSLAAFRHRLMPVAPVIHDEVEVKSLERNCYHGGEIRVFQFGERTGYHVQVDVNSLYPHVMRTNYFPRCLVQHSESDRWRSPSILGDPSECCAEVAISSFDDTYLARTKSGVISAQGEFVAYLCGLELDRACRSGHVQAVRRFSRYDMAPLFRPFVDDLAARKESASEAKSPIDAKLAKMLLNCLHGKFGQKSNRLELVPDMAAPLPWRQWSMLDLAKRTERIFLSIGWQVFEQIEGDENGSAIVAISAFITSAAREYMRSIRQIAGESNCLYQSCDSLIVNYDGHRNLWSKGMIHDSRMGLLKVEWTGDEIDINGDHCYRIGDKVVEGWHSADASTSIAGDFGQWEYRRQGSQVKETGGDLVQYRWKSKSRHSTYAKGEVLPDGAVIPLIIRDPAYGAAVPSPAASATVAAT